MLDDKTIHVDCTKGGDERKMDLVFTEISGDKVTVTVSEKIDDSVREFTLGKISSPVLNRESQSGYCWTLDGNRA